MSFSPNYSAGGHVASLVGIVDAMAAEIDGLILEIERELGSRPLDLAAAPQAAQADSSRAAGCEAGSHGRPGVPLQALVGGSAGANGAVPSQSRTVPVERGEGEAGRYLRLQITTDMRVAHLNWLPQYQ